MQLTLELINAYECYLVFLLKSPKVTTMTNQISSIHSYQNDDYRKRSQAEMQRRFVDLQFKRSELEKKLKRVNDVLFSLGREMEQHFSYDQLYK